ncbi:hypothetical protein HanXRQr2_Chr10g0453511 [Helianthus annuus]|uniref:Uncharacterized protein n=1 Tax=Helianthus annuus TaxID=4232 RepID=A0A9K3HZJ6_HELAN|nr:hypothetical protein HanXRQr2_Chr10g0453511 [Helianthus annuus]KAJ0514717.1 hypothetical protein HanHA300_Chr10g0372771 [Helianthus annuus]KAJ0530872.1 hypothetical protein HanHA89_Chr10g0394901 [Helianthus annuus]KAJ0701096.1 hypothetical protein HanOQP8_Chr10g0375661 [Helianthus annuus]KAJ0884765.1 hypothetical protein HanPSC8_Chr10g0437681 [Helianthus annuus]
MNPDEVTLVVSLSACGQIGALESGRWIHSVTPRNFFASNNVPTRVLSLHVALILNKGLMLTNLESI